MKKLFTSLLAIIVLLISTSSISYAVVEINPELHPQYAPVFVMKSASSADYANYVLQLLAGGLLYLAAPVAILFIAIAGLRYVTSYGEQTQIEAAKNTLTWAVIGLVVIIMAYAIVRAALYFLTGF